MCTTARGDPVALLDRALTALEAVDPARLSDGEVTRRVTDLQDRVQRLQGLLTRDVAAAHARGAAAADGFGSTQAWLRRRMRLDSRAASRQVAVATGLAELPDTAAALVAGEIGLEHAAAICQAGKDLGDVVMAGGAEKLLLEAARFEPAKSVWRLARVLRERLDPDGEEDRQARLQKDRWLAVARTFRGAVSVQGLLDPVTGELLFAALAAYTPAATPEDDRSAGQRRADALAEVCRAALGNPVTPAPRPQVTVTVGLEALRGELGHGPATLGPAGVPVGASTVRRLACDAGVIPALLGSASEPLDIGRQTRAMPTGLRRALALRDQGCRFPGCDQPVHRCDGHHLRHWSAGGPTTLTNLVMLCPWHHWLVHEGHWTISYDPCHNVATASRPNGTPYDLVSGPRGQSP